MSKERRQEVFRALVQAQDGGATVQDSRLQAARLFGLETDEVRRIEREGIEGGWPPLG
jgi:hypothetical protein